MKHQTERCSDDGYLCDLMGDPCFIASLTVYGTMSRIMIISIFSGDPECLCHSSPGEHSAQH